ncbi:MAG: ABC transporter substrate-binding protein, partial [Acidimicrobiia bacterium]
PGAPPVIVAAPADLSGPDARRCRSFQLGMVLALGFLNADGGVSGRKVVLEAVDDGGDPERARQVAEGLRDRAHLAAPCGKGSAAAGQAFGADLPVVVADPSTPPYEGSRVFRMAGDPYAEGWAVARTVIRNTFPVAPEAPRSIAVLSEAGDPTTERVIAGLEAGLALDPDVAEQVEGDRPSDSRGVKVVSLVHEQGAPLGPLVLTATRSADHVASFLRVDPDELAPALDSLAETEIDLTNAVIVPNRHFDEAFYRSSALGRRGGVIVLGEVAPDSEQSLVYTNLVLSIFSGERPTIDGLRGYVAGKAIVEGLKGGTSPGEIARRLRLVRFGQRLEADTGEVSDGAVSGWSPAASSAGSWRFFLYRGNFIPMGLIPGDDPAPGRFFDEGAWNRVITGNVGLCGPQKAFTANADCTGRPAGSGDQKETG